MIGRGYEDSVYCIYNFNDSFIKKIEKQCQAGNFNIIFQSDYSFGMSDDLHFKRKGINAFSFHDEDFEDYHQPSDDSEKINFRKIAKVTKAAFNMSTDLSNNEYSFEFIGKAANPSENQFGNAFLRLDATMIKGKKIKFTADAKVGDNRGNMWLREDMINGQMGFFNNMGHHPIKDSVWRKYEIEGQLSEMAESIYFGAFLVGKGEFYLDNYQLFYQDEHLKWHEIEIQGSDFELKTLDGLDKNTWIIRPDKSGEISVILEDRKTGKKYLKIVNY